MDPTTIPLWLALAGSLIFGLFLGVTLSSQRARRTRRELEEELRTTHLQRLDAETALARCDKAMHQVERKDRLLRLTLDRLSKANQHVTTLENSLHVQERQQFRKLADLQLAAVTARQAAIDSQGQLKRLRSQLELLHTAAPNTQTIKAPPAKSYGQAECVAVSVVDQHAGTNGQEVISRVTNRDSVRLTRLLPSNEEQLAELASDS